MDVDAIFTAPDGRLRAIWRFAIGAAYYFAARQLAATAAYPLRESHLIVYNAVARTLLLVFLLAGFAFFLISLDEVKRSLLASMGLAVNRRALRDAATGVLLGVILIGLAAVAITFLGTLRVSLAPAGANVAGLVAGMIFLLLVAAMAEEVIFRGYPFQRLVEAAGAPAAVVLSAAGFGLAHIHNPHASVLGAVNTAAVGVLFALAYLRTRSLWLPWGIHFGWNFTLGVLLGLPVSGFRFFAVLTQGTAGGPVWLTGGAYGIEASATGTAVIILGIVVVTVFVRPRRMDGPAIPEEPPVVLKLDHEEQRDGIQ